MGLDLAEQINQQMRFVLPKVNDTDSVARTAVILFTPGASNAKVLFEDFLSSRFRDENAVRFADLSEGSQVISELILRGETIVRFRKTPIVILYVAAMGEEFQLLHCRNRYQVVRIYQRRNEINANEPDALFVQDSGNGIDSLVFLIYLQTYFIHVPMPVGGGVLESWTARLTFDEWIRRLYCQLSADLADLQDVPADEEAVRKQIVEQSERCCKAFVKKLRKTPSLAKYPIDASGLEEIRAELPNLLQKIFGKSVQLQLKKILTNLYGKAEDGQPKALYFHKLFFDEQKAESMFEHFWHDAGAWYYKMPISQLEDLLVSVLSECSAESREKYEARFSELRKSRLPGHIFINGRKIQDIIAALVPWEKDIQKLYHSYAKAWFWEAALVDAREGHLYQSIAAAKRRIESQQDDLRNCNAQKEARPYEQYLANWNQDIAEYAKQSRPLDADWTAEILDKTINAGWPLSTNVNYKPKLYGFLRCENKQERSKIQGIVFPGCVTTADWNFISSAALRGIAVVVSIAPTAISIEETGGVGA